ncbi:MAG: response regulator transcription factor [Actinobacteria bacterium]|nr:response regulator transcription factor [Actinomycetota bacterium]
MNSERTISVFIADDHAVTRDGIKTMLSVNNDFVFAGEAANGRDAVDLCSKIKPDVILMDLDMPVMDGVSAIKILNAENPDIKIMALTSFPDKKMVREAFKAGASGYMLKNASPQEIASAIREAFSGRVSMSREIADALFEEIKKPAQNYNLGEQELKILNLLAKGYSNKKISEILYISQHTVKFHISNILSKMGAATRAEAASIAIKNNIIS